MNIILSYTCVFMLLLLSSCDIEDQIDPNAPSINSVAENATLQQLNLLVNGIESSMRNGIDTYVSATGSIARELYIFDADPRNTLDLLGKEGAQLDNNTFYLTAVYNTRYRVIKTSNILLDALDNTSNVTGAEDAGYRGFAKTIQALMYSMVLDYLGDNGLRFDVSDPENLGPFLSEANGRQAILELLDEAANDLNGAEFAFDLSSGFAGFDTPATFATFNRAIAARVAARGGDYDGAIRNINESFFDVAGDFSNGPKHVFSLSSGDLQNPAFKQRGQNGDQFIVHNRFIEDALPDDARLSKFNERVDPTSQDGLNGTHETALYEDNLSPIDIIRNEELMFILAESRMNTNDLPGAVEVLNIIRNNNGVGDYTGGMTLDEITMEWIFQKSYSFWGEGQLMFDYRKYGLLNDSFLPLDRMGDLVHTQFPIPLSENQ